MPFIPHTPESLLARADSKDPATTCKGITSSGRACRRSLAISSHSSPTSKKSPRDGVLAVLPASDNAHDGAAAFFCWQHKEQAAVLASHVHEERAAKVVPLKERTSVDTLVDRLGLLDMEDEVQPRRGGIQRRRPVRKETLPTKWQDVRGPLLPVGSGVSPPHRQIQAPHSQGQRGESNLLLSLFCCVRSVDPEYVPPPRPTQTLHYPKNNYTAMTETGQQAARVSISALAQTPARERPVTSVKPLNTASFRPAPLNDHQKPVLPRNKPSQTENLLSLIPKTLPPQTASLLLSELAKPVSAHDEEGFIYIFWLTSTSTTLPDPETATSLLNSPTRPSPRARRESELMKPHASTSGKTPTILLKLGRASNVQRRMNEWTRQCGYNLSLIRYYPYIPSSSGAETASSSPVKVPHAHKVERLIHLELGDKRVKRGCEACGKEHREWFEIEASRKGLSEVDGVVRRWVEWARAQNP